ncbi:MAG: pitrilysin family protein [Parcubacteria group bacterium]
MKKYEITILDNGLKVITSYTPQFEGMHLALWVKTGARYENENELGFSHLFEHLLFLGNDKYKNKFEISSAVEAKGAKINGATGRDRVYFYIEGAAEYADDSFDVLSHLILNPLLKKEDLEKEKQIVLREMDRSKDNPMMWATRIAYKKNFEDHPLANDPLGSEETVLAADIETLKNYHKKVFIPQNSALIVTGGLSHDDAEKLAKKYLGEWKGQKDNPSETNIPILPRKKEDNLFEGRDIGETQLRFYYLTGGVDEEEDNAALEIIASHLGYGMSSLLNQEIREKRKLTYNISAQIQTFSDAGLFGIATSTKNPKEMIHAVKEIMEDLEEHLSKQNFGEMKMKLVNFYKTQNIDPFYITDIGRGFILRDALHTTEDYISVISSITEAQLINAAKKYLSPDNLLIVALGPEGVK